MATDQAGPSVEQQKALAMAMARKRKAESQAQPEIQPVEAASPRMQRGLERRAERQQQLEQLRQQAQQAGVPLARDLPEIGASAEMNQLNLPAFKSAAASLFTFDDQELGNILTEQLGAEIIQDPEGSFVARLPSGDFAINKPGFSPQDVAKAAATGLAFTPAGRLSSIPAQAAGGAATAATIEGGQAALGGSFDPEDVIIEAAAPVVLNKLGQAVQRGAHRVKGRNDAAEKYVDDLLSRSDDTVDKPASEGLRLEPMESPPPNKSSEFFERVNRMEKESAKRAEIREALKEGSVEAVGWKVDDAGRVVKDPIQRQLVREGVSDQAVVALKDLPPPDKEAALRMLQIARRHVKKLPGHTRTRPNVVIGNNAMKRFNYLQEQKNKASKQIGRAVQKDIAGQPVSIDDIYDDLLDTLQNEFRVTIDGDKLDFKNSLIDGSNTRAVRRVVNLLKPDYSDARQLHQDKQAITNQLDYTDQGIGQPPLDKGIERLLKDVRARINDRLRGMSEDYAKANDQYAQAIAPMVQFSKSMGRNYDPFSERVDNFVGQELRKVITNYASANPMIEAIDSLDATARAMGGKFDDDLMTQVTLNNELERLLGSFAPGSARGITQTAGDVVADVAVDSRLGQWAIQKGKEAIDRARFEPPAKAKLELIDNMEKLLKE